MKHDNFLQRDTRYMLNTALPYIMHIDLNSCFAIIEQQANRLLRGKPVGIAAYDTPRGFVIAASYEAKAKGVKLGVNVEQSRALAPGMVILTPDPPKYREAHRRFKEVLQQYSPDVTPKSIDEFVLDLSKSPVLKSTKSEILNSNIEHRSSIVPDTEPQIHNAAMLQLGTEIKQRIASSLGEWVTVNIGISTNRFLAKHAAGFGKPDGMTLIDCTNIEKWFRCSRPHDCSSNTPDCKPVVLVDLPGINTRYRARLRLADIYTPLDFLAADMNVLKKQVFKSINGYHWHRRLRGYEADDIEFSRKSIGHQYALPRKTTDVEKLERLLMKLCEKTGRRLRKNNYYATGIHLYLGFAQDSLQATNDGGQFGARDTKRQGYTEEPASFEHMHRFPSWHHGEKVYHRLYSTADIYASAKKLLHMAEIPNNVRALSVHVFDLRPWQPYQLSIFDKQSSKSESTSWRTNSNKEPVETIETGVRGVEAGKRVSDAVDAINNRYGEFVVTPAMMMDMSGEILDRIAFGQVRDM